MVIKQSSLVGVLVDAGFRVSRTAGGHEFRVFESGLVRVCPDGEEGTDVYVFSDKIGRSCAYTMHFSGSTPAAVIVAAASMAVAS